MIPHPEKKSGTELVIAKNHESGDSAGGSWGSSPRNVSNGNQTVVTDLRYLQKKMVSFYCTSDMFDFFLTVNLIKTAASYSQIVDL